MISVWANSKDVPGVVCKDARLTDKTITQWPWSDRPITTTDQLYGEAGWDVGINFLAVEDLAGQLETLFVPKYVNGGGRRITRGEIKRLSIHAHGNEGVILINGKSSKVTLTAESIQDLQTPLNRIGLMTPDDSKNPAVILFQGCLAASGKSGTRLITALSKIWPNRKVVGFVTLGFAPGGDMYRSGEHCNEPGMRATLESNPGAADKAAGKYWGDLKSWPWASENAPSAKVALNGKLIAGLQFP